MLPQEVKIVLQRLEAAGYEAYAVGGCVRDTLRGVVPHDYDVTTSALPEQVLSLFAPHAIPTGLQHGTVTVRENHQSFEVTTFRADGPYTDHRRPDSVRFSTDLREDLARRDFTINAMAMDVRGTLHDPYGGRADLASGVIRCVGAAEQRFSEDALRIMRCLRFAAVLGYEIEEQTAAAAGCCAPLLRDIAAERIHEEIEKLLCGEKAAEVLLADPDILGVFLPEILPCVGFDQQNHHHSYDAWEHTARAVGAAPREPILRWAMLLHDLGKPATFAVDEGGVGHFYGHPQRSAALAREICQRLRMDKKSAQRIALLIEWHMRQIEPAKKAVRRVLRQIGEEALRQLLLVKRADASACHGDFAWQTQALDAVEAVLDGLLAEDACFSLRHLAVDGRDMMALGLRGSAIGAALNEALERVVEGELPNEKEALLQWVKDAKK